MTKTLTLPNDIYTPEMLAAHESMQRHSATLAAFIFAQQDRLLRRLLERWVSELDPAIAMGSNGEILGLCDAGADLGSKPYIFNPFNPRAAG